MNLSDLSCPCNKKSDIHQSHDKLFCSDPECNYFSKHGGFKYLNSTPVLISFLSDTVCEVSRYDENKSPIYSNYVKRSNFSFLYNFKKIFASNNSHLTKIVDYLILSIENSNSIKKILIIGAGDGAFGFQSIINHTNVEVTGIDIYPGSLVDYLADAHYLPFKSNIFDIVLIQAVLEHVIDPNIVSEEIFRVLKPSGLVYSESSFMQQVHEGAYDFYRFTPVGHRYIFKKFEVIFCGGCGSSGIVLAWSFRYFFWALTRSKRVASFLSIPFFLILPLFDPLLSKKSYFDSSSAAYFLGKKSLKTISQKNALAEYKGMQD